MQVKRHVKEFDELTPCKYMTVENTHASKISVKSHIVHGANGYAWKQNTEGELYD